MLYRDSYVPTAEGCAIGTYWYWCGSRHFFFSALYLLNQLVDFDQTCIDNIVGKEERVNKILMN